MAGPTLKGKTLFITGASRGIGLAIGLRAARDGANVAIAAKTAEANPKLPGTIYSAANEIEAAGGRALPLVVDVRDEAAVRGALDETATRFGGIDIVVNNASAISLTDSQSTEMKRFDLMHQINARGTFMVSKFAAPDLFKAENPHILMLSPPLDMKEKWFARHTAYSMAKFGMSLVVLGLAGEFRAQGRRSQCALAAHDDRDGGGQEFARRRRPDARFAHARNSGGRCASHFLQTCARIHRALPDRRHVPRRKRRHGIRPLPRRPDARSHGRFLRARREHRAGAAYAPRPGRIKRLLTIFGYVSGRRIFSGSSLVLRRSVRLLPHPPRQAAFGRLFFAPP